MPEALALLENVMQNAQADPMVAEMCIQLIEKSRMDAKSSQGSNFNALFQYGVYGPYNSQLNQLSIEQLRQLDPQELLDLLKNLKNYKHTVMYYGPMSQQELDKTVSKLHKTGKKLSPVTPGKEYTEQLTPINEVYIAPYEAKNIYMIQYHNEGKPFSLEEVPAVEFDEVGETGFFGTAC